MQRSGRMAIRKDLDLLGREDHGDAWITGISDARCLISSSAAQSSLPAQAIMTPGSASPLCFSLSQI